MKKLCRCTSLLLCVSLITGLFSACTPPAQGGGAPQSAAPAPSAAGGDGKYLIAENNWGQGVGALDLIENEARYTVTAYGCDFQAYNDEFSADKMKSNIQGMLSAGTDGILFFGAAPTLIPVVAQMCEQAKVPFVIFDQIPQDEQVIERLEANPYYVGSVGTDNFAAGVNMAKHALEDGKTKAIILGGAVGDPVHDARIQGFTTTFEQGGGTITGVGRCDNPASGTTKCDDLIAASPDSDAIYALTGDYATSALTAMDNHSASMSVYVTDSTANTLQDLKDGKVVVGDGGSSVAVTLATTLLVNWLDGNQLKTEAGTAPYINTIVAFPIYADSAENYQKYWLTGNPLTEAQLKALRGPEITMADIDQFVADYTLENIVAGH